MITLGVIGVVAALTIPGLIADAQDRQFRAAYKESISILSQAMKLVYNETEETYTSVDFVQMPIYICKLQRYMKVNSSGIDCSQVSDELVYTSTLAWPLNRGAQDTTYWHKSHNWFDKNKTPQMLNSGYTGLTFRLMNGMMINFNCYNQIFVDVNGDKKPNTIGRDIYFMVFANGTTSPNIGFSTIKTFVPNGCSRNGQNATPTLTKDNYIEDCIHGSGWGCSFML